MAPNWLHFTDAILKSATATFGERVRYWPKDAPSFEINAIFDETYEVIDPNSGVKIQSTQPRLGVRLSQFQFMPDEGDRVELLSRVYQVIEFQPDGSGGAVLMLQRVGS